MRRSHMIYLAARYSEAERMRVIRTSLHALDYEVTSRWIDHHDGRYPISCTPEQLATDPQGCAPIAVADLDDLRAADTLIAFSPDPGAGGGKGGRHVEFGAAVALGLRVILVGAREHVFHTLPAVEHFDGRGFTWWHLMHALDPDALHRATTTQADVTRAVGS
ncbi:MAG: hypothetical protein L0I76_08455 [Pseudonocardia sp.]|nr:hypothetical protein [Pseudonocardia sp.]